MKSKPKFISRLKKELGLFYFKNKDYKNAGVYLSQFPDCQKDTLQCFKKTLDYENAFNYFTKNEVNDRDRDVLTDYLVTKFKKIKAYEVLAWIFKEKNQIAQSLSYYIQAGEYKLVKTFIKSNDSLTSKDLVKITNDLELVSKLKKSNLQQKSSNYTKWVNRLHEVKNRKEVHQQ